MSNTPRILTTFLSALILVCAISAAFTQPALAQTAQNLECNGCVSGKDIKNKSIRKKDLRNKAVNGAKVRDNSLTGADIRNGSIGPADLAPGTALGLEGVAVIGAADFHGQAGTQSLEWIVAFEGFVGPPSNSLVPGCIVAPVHLPDGVTVTEMELIFIDNNGIADFDMRLRRASLLDGSDLDLARVVTSGADPALRRSSDNTINQAVVDAIDFTYFLASSTCLTTFNHRIFGVRVFYQ